MSTFSYLKKEPLFAFLLIAALLFVADYSLNQHKKNVINITSETRTAIFNQEMKTKGSALTPVEESAAINTYINNRVMLADAIRLGLDNDRTIQTVLLKKYRVLNTATVPEPSREELEAYYNNHSSDYMSPVTFDIEQIFFGVGVSIPENFDVQLHGVENTNIVLDKLHLSSVTLPKMSEREMSARMGKDVSDVVIKASLNSWVGPLTNERGSYFIRVLALHESTLQSFTEVQAYVRDALINFNQESILQKKIASLKENYKITIADGDKK